MDMSIASASAQYSQTQVQQEASMKVASIAQDQAEQQVENINKLAESLGEVTNSSHPTKGQAVDVFA